MAAVDKFATFGAGFNAPYADGLTVTPSDSTDLANVTRAINVDSAGLLKVTMLNGETVLLYLPAGMTTIRVTRIWATGKTCGNVVALW